MATYPMTMYGLRELQPGPRWRDLFTATWPAYRRWYLRDGLDARPSPTAAAAALARHMPELLPTWAKLSKQTSYDQTATTMLTQWNMPAFAPAAACSQVALVDSGPALVRNYDYHPDLFECVTISTDYLKPVIGTADCLWGLLDGMNADGLAVSLTFGGSRVVGDGFAIPLVVRYVLETCSTLTEARGVLARLPIAMAYNLTMIDRSDSVLTAHVRPGHEAEFRRQPLATNHRWRQPGDVAHATRYQSVERLDRLTDLLDTNATSTQIAAEMLRPPLYSRDYAHAFGTLYTACYRPAEKTLTYLWPGTSWSRTYDSDPGTITVNLSDG